MEMNVNIDELNKLLCKQLNSFFSFDFNLNPFYEEVLERIEKCFSRMNNKYYKKYGGGVLFSPYHSCQYLFFLYTLSNTLYKHGIDSKICDKIYYLNKIMNSIDLYYQIELPVHWFSDHPLGTVLGRAKYNDYFSFIQGCTVGNNNGIYPTFGKYVTMYAHSSVIGNCNIGDNVLIGANTNIKNEDVPSNSIVFGNSPNLIIINKTEDEIRAKIKNIWL